MTDTVTVYTPGHWDMADSYGLIACQLARHLSRLGVYVNAISMGDRLVDGQPADVRAIVEQPIRADRGGLLLGYPTSYERYSPLAMVGAKVAVTMFESTKLPPGWTPVLNQCDAVVVPSQFCADVFAGNGVTAPIHVVPLGIGEAYQPVLREEREVFTFLAFLDRGRRKGGLCALQAFLKAFGDDPAVRLVLKGREGQVSLQAVNHNVDIVQADMTEEELYRLYLSADVLVNPNMGEGFGLIPREFAATGGLSLATDWSGTAEDIDYWGLPIPYTLVPADWKGALNLEPHAPLGMWAQPDESELALLMRAVYEARHEWRPLAYARAPRLHEMYSWRAFAEGVYAIWQEVAIGDRVTA